MVQRFPITLTQLTYFVECAKVLNMTEASSKLHVAQSAVSTAVSHLEKALDTTLFIRQHSKGLILTRAGEGLLRDAQQIFSNLTETVDRIRVDKHDVRGTISIAFFDTLSPFLLPQLLSHLRQKHPGLAVDVIEGDYEENIAALRTGRAEVAINYRLADDDGIQSETVRKVRPHVIVSTDHALASKTKINLTELAGDPFVLLDLPNSREYFLGVLQEAGVAPSLKYQSSSYETVRSMVALGLGYSILNQRPSIDATYTGEHVVILEIMDSVSSLDISIASLSQVGQSARARAIAEAVREVVGEKPSDRK